MPDGQRVARESLVRKRPEARDRPRFNNAAREPRGRAEPRTPGAGCLAPSTSLYRYVQAPL